MQRLEVSGAVRPIYGSLGVKWLIYRVAQKIYIRSLLINIIGINLNEISISGWECNIMFSQQMYIHLRTSAPAKSACAICWAKIIRAPVLSVEKVLHYTLTLKYKFHLNLFQRYWWVKSLYIFLGHSVFMCFTWVNMLSFIMYMQCVFYCIRTDISKIYCDHITSLGFTYCLIMGNEEL